jgi:hypothetical protein
MRTSWRRPQPAEPDRLHARCGIRTVLLSPLSRAAIATVDAAKNVVDARATRGKNQGKSSARRTKRRWRKLLKNLRVLPQRQERNGIRKKPAEDVGADGVAAVVGGDRTLPWKRLANRSLAL